MQKYKQTNGTLWLIATSYVQHNLWEKLIVTFGARKGKWSSVKLWELLRSRKVTKHEKA